MGTQSSTCLCRFFLFRRVEPYGGYLRVRYCDEEEQEQEEQEEQEEEEEREEEEEKTD